MHDHPFESLREALLRTGVAPRHARRAVLELDTHYHQLVAEGLARGDSEDAARIAAREVLGTDQVLIDRYAGMPELRAWSSRWLVAWFTLLPLSFIALFVVAMVALCLIGWMMSGYLHHLHVSADVSSRIDFAARLLFLWVFPLAIAAAFAVFAYRQRVALHWPVAGIAILCGLVSLINVNVVLTGGVTPGQVGAGIGISLHSLLEETAHAGAILMLVVVPLWLAWRRHRLVGTMVD